MFGPQSSQHPCTFKTWLVLQGHGMLESSVWSDCSCGGASSSSSSTPWTCPMQDLTKHFLDLLQSINGGASRNRRILSMMMSEDFDDLPGPDSTYRPLAVTLTTLGWLKHMEVPCWQYFEHQYLRFLHNTITYDWQCIPGGV